jgi:uncharacterized protein (TIGR03083 family)
MTKEFSRLTRAEVAALREALRGGGEAAWNAPSHCKGWAAKDVVAHLLLGGRMFGGAMRAAMDGTDMPPFDRARMEADRATLAALPQEQALDELGELTAEQSAFLDGLDAEAAARSVTLPFGTLTMWQLAAVRLNEVAIHHWDVRAGATRDAEISPEAVPALSMMAGQRMGMLARGEKTDGTWQLDVSAPQGGALGAPLTLRVQGDEVTVQPGPAQNPDARLVLDGDAFIRLVWGRLDLPAAIASGKVRVEGDREHALALQRLFTGV